MTNHLSGPKRNAAAGFISPDGSFVDLQHGSHTRHARRMGTSLPALLKKGWIRKAGQGAYQGDFAPVTLRAIENDLVKDYEDLKMGGRLGAPIDSIVLEHTRNEASIQLSLQAFVESGFDLRFAIRKLQGADPVLRDQAVVILVRKAGRRGAGK